MMEQKPEEPLVEKLLKVVLKVGVGMVSGYLTAEAYDKCTTPEEKEEFESRVKTHHGEAGVLVAGVGIATKSPTLAGFGGGLMLHDREDAAKWFSGDKYELCAE